MYINAINPVFSAKIKPLVILAKENSKDKYLYNEVADIVKEFKVPALFHNYEIDISSPTKEVISKLNALGILYKFVK